MTEFDWLSSRSFRFVKTFIVPSVVAYGMSSAEGCVNRYTVSVLICIENTVRRWWATSIQLDSMLRPLTQNVINTARVTH